MMILIKFQFFRQEDTRSVFLKKMKFFGEKNKKKEKKNYIQNVIGDNENGVVKRKIKKKLKIKQ